MRIMTTRQDLEGYVHEHLGAYCNAASSPDMGTPSELRAQLVNALLDGAPRWGEDWAEHLETRVSHACAEVLGGQAVYYC